MYTVAYCMENRFHCGTGYYLEIQGIFFPSQCPCNRIILISVSISHFSPGREVFQQHHVKVLDEIFSQFLDRNIQFRTNLSHQSIMPDCNENTVFLGHKIFLIEIGGHRTPPNFSKP